MKTIRKYQTRNRRKQIENQLFLKIILCAAILFIILLQARTPLQAQVRATGHVFAEIVEPTAISAKANNNHFIETSEIISSNELVIARVKLSGGADLNIDVMVQTSQLTAANGQMLSFSAFACPECYEDDQHSTAGDRLYTLKATPGGTLQKQKHTTYTGRYNVVFMYN